MELVRMKLAQLRANPLNSRTHFGGLDELADRLELTPGRPGEPLLPLVAVRDANVGRIIDGERRYRAMKKRKKVNECWVFLCDDMDEAAQAMAMLAANDREQLDEGELCRGYQQALMLGVPEESVDLMAGRSGAGKALKRAIERNGGKTVQLSLDQIAAAEEFADNDEDYRTVMESDNWRGTAGNIRYRRREEGEKAELEAAIAEISEAHGLQVADKPPKKAALAETLYTVSAATIRKSGPTWAAAGRILVRPQRREYYTTSWTLYDPPRELSDEEAEAVKSLNRWRSIRSAGEKRRREWLAAELMQAGGSMAGRLMPLEMFVAQYYQDNRSREVEEFCKRSGVEWDEWPMKANAWMCADAWAYIDHITNECCDAIADETKRTHIEDPWMPHIKLMRAMTSSGYEMDDDEKAFLAMCEKRAAGSKKAKKGGK